MRTQAEFKEFYQNDLQATLKVLEAKRKSLANQIIYFFGGTAVLAIACLLIFQHPAPALVIGALGFAISWFVTSGPSKKFNRQFKLEVIQKLVHFMSPELSYSQHGSISQGTFSHSGIFKQGIDRYDGEDYVEGKIDKTEIVFSEVHAEYKTTSTDSKGNRKTNWHTIFKGIFFIADFNKHFHGKTYVLPDFAQGLFGSFGQTLQSWGKSHGELVKLEDIDFEKAFVCYSNDQTEARYILSPALMQKILQLKNKVDRKIFLSFVSSKVFIAIDVNYDLFETSLFSKLDQYHKIKGHFDDLNLALGIVEDLNLNTRIWTKD